MANFINIYSSITAYNADETKEYPNVSYLETEDEVKWQATEPIDQEHVVAKYNITDTSSATKVLNTTNNITKMIVDGVEQPSVTTGYTFSSTGTHKVKYKPNSSWNAGQTFAGVVSLTSVTIPSGVTGIDTSAFVGCTGLTSVTIPDTVTNIGLFSFSGCSSLTSVSIGSGVTAFSSSAFERCRALASFTVEATTPPTLGSSAFNYTNNTFIIYVPSASVNAYKTASGWSTYASRIQAIQ